MVSLVDPESLVEDEPSVEALLAAALAVALLVVRAESPFKTVADLAAQSKERQLTMASAGTGTVGHISGEMFAKRAGVRMMQTANLDEFDEGTAILPYLRDVPRPSAASGLGGITGAHSLLLCGNIPRGSGGVKPPAYEAGPGV